MDHLVFIHQVIYTTHKQPDGHCQVHYLPGLLSYAVDNNIDEVSGPDGLAGRAIVRIVPYGLDRSAALYFHSQALIQIYYRNKYF